MPSHVRPVYLDCNASTPVEPEVLSAMLPWFSDEPGNPSSWTHEHGQRARSAVETARARVAGVLGARAENVIFTSGATEANNMALLGLEGFGRRVGKCHIVTTMVEHKAILEPVRALADRGFEVTLVPVTEGGHVSVSAIEAALRPDTLLVSVMHVNSETAVVQPLRMIGELLGGRDVVFHSDAAQGFGKEMHEIGCDRLDLISISAHKCYGPKGVGALVMRRRGAERTSLEPLLRGGGQERGLRAGTVPVPLVVGFGTAAELAKRDREKRSAHCSRFRDVMLSALENVPHDVNGELETALPHCLNISFRGADANAVIAVTKHIVSVSTGSACESADTEGSRVVSAMGFSAERAREAIRFSWCHLTPAVDWDEFRRALRIVL